MLNNVTVETLYDVFNERLVARRPYVIATNLTPTALKARYGERIASRLLDAGLTTLIKLSGQDVRVAQRK